MDALVSLMDKLAVYFAQQIQRIHHEAAQAEEMSCFQSCITAGFPRSRKISPKRRKGERDNHFQTHLESVHNEGRRLSENYQYQNEADSHPPNYQPRNLNPHSSGDNHSLMNSFNGSLHSSLGRKERRIYYRLSEC